MMRNVGTTLQGLVSALQRLASAYRMEVDPAPEVDFNLPVNAFPASRMQNIGTSATVLAATTGQVVSRTVPAGQYWSVRQADVSNDGATARITSVFVSDAHGSVVRYSHAVAATAFKTVAVNTFMEPGWTIGVIVTAVAADDVVTQVYSVEVVAGGGTPIP